MLTYRVTQNHWCKYTTSMDGPGSMSDISLAWQTHVEEESCMWWCQRCHLHTTMQWILTCNCTHKTFTSDFISARIIRNTVFSFFVRVITRLSIELRRLFQAGKPVLWWNNRILTGAYRNCEFYGSLVQKQTLCWGDLRAEWLKKKKCRQRSVTLLTHLISNVSDLGQFKFY